MGKELKKRQSQNKFMKFIVVIPVKALSKARDFYVRSITGCASSANLTNGIAASHLPRSRSASVVGSARSSSCGGDEDYGELIRAASVRRLGHENEIDMILRSRSQIRSENGGGLPKSSSAGMARIDEESACEFGGEGGDHGGEKSKSKVRDLVYPRSKSCAAPITKTLN